MINFKCLRKFLIHLKCKETERVLIDNITCVNLRHRFTRGAAHTHQLTCARQTARIAQAWQKVIKLDYHVVLRHGGGSNG